MDNFEYKVCSVIESYLDEFEPVNEIGDTWSNEKKAKVVNRFANRAASAKWYEEQFQDKKNKWDVTRRPQLRRIPRSDRVKYEEYWDDDKRETNLAKAKKDRENNNLAMHRMARKIK